MKVMKQATAETPTTTEMLSTAGKLATACTPQQHAQQRQLAQP